MIAAAGGALWRPGSGGIEVAVVHRPRYDDWSLPKGKLRTAEPAVVGAAREVEEETGFAPQVQRRLVQTSYRVSGMRKIVDYWAMRCVSGQFAATNEVDEIRWLSPAGAAKALTRDRQVLDALLAQPADTTTVVLVRHGRAGHKRDWDGDDALRPLDEIGGRQARGLAEAAPVFHPARVLSAGRVRCVDTVEPLAARLGLAVEIDPVLNEGEHSDADQMAARLRGLAEDGQPVVACSQGGLIAETLAVLVRKSQVKVDTQATSKGSAWALSFARTGQLVGADFYPPFG